MSASARIVLAALILVSVSCAPGPTVEIEGTISYTQRIMLPPTAIARAYVVPLGGTGVPGPELAEFISDPPSRVPVPFRLEIDTGKLTTGARYQLRGEITVDDQLMFFGYQELGDDPVAWPSEVELVVKPAT